MLKINSVEIALESSDKLIGLEIDDKLNFENYMLNICKKTRLKTES